MPVRGNNIRLKEDVIGGINRDADRKKTWKISVGREMSRSTKFI